MGFLIDNNLTLNGVEIAKRERISSGLGLIDLTESNPTHCGLIFPKDILISSTAKYLETRSYNPNASGLPLTREAIAEYYSERGENIKPEQIVVTASTSEAYRLLFSLLCEPKENLLAPDVTYPLFEYFALDQRINLHNYRMLEARDWDIDPISIDLALDKLTRGILLVSPHNPTGKIQRERINFLAELKLPLIVDEVFAEFVHDGGTTPVLGTLYTELPVFHLNGISKMFALPDLKLGWIVMNEKAYDLYGERLEFLNDTYLSASSLTQAILPILFQEGKTFQNEMISRVKENVFFVKSKLEEFGFPEIKIPQGGTFILPKLPDGIDEEKFVIKLLHNGVSVHPGYFYNIPNNHIMISCLPTRDVIEEGLEIMRKSL